MLCSYEWVGERLCVCIRAGANAHTHTYTADILTKAPHDPDEETKLKKRAEYAAEGAKMHSLVSLLAQVLMFV